MRLLERSYLTLLLAVAAHCAAECQRDDSGSVARRLSHFLRLETVADVRATRSVGANAQAFTKAKAFLRDNYAALLSRDDVSLVEVNEWSMLLEWQGAQRTLNPVMLYGHYDVVPVSNSTYAAWTHGPFSGVIDNGFIWGRGALDMKSSVLAVLEAWQFLHESGFAPQRTLLLGIGHDEEIGGQQGALQIAALLEKRGTRLDVLLDEGTVVLTDGMPPLVKQPVALIGTAEKGSATFKISVDTPGGHSSMPPTNGFHTARVMSDIVQAIDRRPPPITLQPPMTDLLVGVAPHAPSFLRSLLSSADRWPLSVLWGRLWGLLGRATASQVRTTAVVTMMQAGVALNVIPQHGEITVNMRLLHNSDGAIQAAESYLLDRIASTKWKAYTSISLIEAVEPSQVTPSQGKWWDILSHAIQDSITPVHQNGSIMDAKPVVLPTLVMGGTDSKHLGRLSENGAYRFLPMQMNRTAGDVEMVHGIDERIRVDVYQNAITYYTRLTEALSVD